MHWPGFWGKLKIGAACAQPVARLLLTARCLDIAFVLLPDVAIPCVRERLSSAGGVSLKGGQSDCLAVLAVLHGLGGPNFGLEDGLFSH
jgi:hypothetical protein